MREDACEGHSVNQWCKDRFFFMKRSRFMFYHSLNSVDANFQIKLNDFVRSTSKQKSLNEFSPLSIKKSVHVQQFTCPYIHWCQQDCIFVRHFNESVMTLLINQNTLRGCGGVWHVLWFIGFSFIGWINGNVWLRYNTNLLSDIFDTNNGTKTNKPPS